MEKVNLAQKFAQLPEVYTPKIVGALNGQLVKLARFRGPYVWHDHAEQDELFFVVEGQLQIAFRDHTVALSPGEFLIVPRGVEHKPMANEDCLVMLFEPEETVTTGSVNHDHTLTPDALETL